MQQKQLLLTVKSFEENSHRQNLFSPCIALY
jgi:hypothetical protein